MSKYRTLFKDDPISVENVEIPVAKIDNLIPEATTIVAQPDNAFVESVRQHGVIQPIVLIKRSRGKKYDLAFGRRRIVAAKLAELEAIPARIFPAGTRPAAILALVENTNRKRNILSEWQAVEALVAQDMSEDDIFATTGLAKQQQRQLLSLRNLAEPLRKAFEEGKIKASVALIASRQKKSVQKKLAVTLKNEGKVKIKDIAEARRVSRGEAVSNLPASLFALPEEDWREEARRSLSTLQNRLACRASRSFLDQLNELISRLDNN